MGKIIVDCIHATGTELIEKIVENDDVLMQQYLDGKEISLEVLKAETRKAVIANKMFPVFTGSALKNVGVQLVLDAVVDYLPSPLDLPPTKGIDPNTDQEITREEAESVEATVEYDHHGEFILHIPENAAPNVSFDDKIADFIDSKDIPATEEEEDLGDILVYVEVPESERRYSVEAWQIDGKQP